MNKDSFKYIKHIIIQIIIMFALIFLTVFLTGGREIDQFNKKDIIIFMLFILSEVATCVCLFITLGKYIKSVPKISHSASVPQTKYEKLIQRRGILLALISYILALGIVILGIIMAPKMNPRALIFTKNILIVCVICMILLIPLNLLLRNQLAKRFEQSSVRDIQQYVYSHRESANNKTEKIYRQLRILRVGTDIYACFLGIIASIIAFLTGTVYTSELGVALCMFSGILFLSALSRIRFRVPQLLFQEDEHYVSHDDYPLLYSLTQKAADVLHCNGKIRIAISDGFNAGIARVSDTYSIQIGAILLNTLSQDELYCVLLHEFSHMTSQNNGGNKERDYHTWIQQGTNPHFLTSITNSLFIYLDSLYSLQFGLYLYASSISIECGADAAMVIYGDAKTAASALLKLKFYELYSWEKGTYDEECYYEAEIAQKDYLTRELNSFLNRLDLRKDAWTNFVSVEILSRTATHPTLKMRLEALGVTSLEMLENSDSDAYIAECKRALSYMDEVLHNELIKEYDATRIKLYLEPKERIASWELAGKPIIGSEYSDIGFALRQLGRNSEAIELYHRAISELSTDAEICLARYFRGCFLLHQFDESGIDDIYYAIEHNSNYIDEGLSDIGNFCCLTGNQNELNIYREKALELAQKQKDVYSHICTLTKNDHLSSEQLPDGMLDDILSYISTIDEGSINEIYLVRKTITDDFFTSAFVIRFNIDISEKKKEKVMHKIFSYLDTCSSWQFSLFDFTELRDIKFIQIKNSCVFKQAKKQTD